MGIITNRRRVMGGKQLPYDAEVEYLASTENGGQKIDTGIINYGFQSMRFVMAFLFTTSSRKILLGNCDANNYRNDLNIEMTTQNNVRLYTRNNSGGLKDITLANPLVANTISRIDVRGDCAAQKFTYTIDNGSATYSGEVDFSTDNPCEGTRQLGMFIDNRKNASALKHPLFVYSCQIYSDDTLLRDFIPVRVGQVGYMYDKVSRQLFGNAGTGAFIIGNDVND